MVREGKVCALLGTYNISVCDREGRVSKKTEEDVRLRPPYTSTQSWHQLRWRGDNVMMKGNLGLIFTMPTAGPFFSIFSNRSLIRFLSTVINRYTGSRRYGVFLIAFLAKPFRAVQQQPSTISQTGNPSR